MSKPKTKSIEVDILIHQLEKVDQVDEDIRSLRKQSCVAPEDDWLDEKFVMAIENLNKAYESIEELKEIYNK